MSDKAQPFRSIFCIEYNNAEDIKQIYGENYTEGQLTTVGKYETIFRAATGTQRRILQGVTVTTKKWKFGEDMTSLFTIDWYLTQAFGQYCGYTRQMSFLQDSDYKKKDCLLKLEMTNCDINDSGYKLFSVQGMIDKFTQAFGITDSSKVIPLFIYYQTNGQKIANSDISTLTFTATLSNGNNTCTLVNYPSSIRAILSVTDQAVNTIRLMIYIESVS
jgi:hypothetical protein